MLYSSVITQNQKLPSFIRDHAVFHKKYTFEKIFPSLGLTNTSCKLKKLNGVIPFVIKHGVKFAGSNDEELWFRICEKILGTPFAYLALASDYLNLKLFRFQNKDSRIVFSCENKVGAWDIATMSMRGIRSCMSWDAANAPALVGSIIDPCCGIIYLTDGKDTKYGTNMLYRAVVRYVVHKDVGPCLFIENLYAQNNNVKANYINLAFATFLHNKTSLPIFYDYRTSYTEIQTYGIIPYSKVVDQYKSNCASYRDSRIQYGHISTLDVMRFPSLQQFKHLFTDWRQ